MYKLTALAGEIVGENDQLSEGENIIGRSRSCSVRVAAPDVSGKHCKIVISSETVAVENLSQNGTLLDDDPVEFITLMNVGQVLKMGATTVLRLDRVGEESAQPEDADSAAAKTSVPSDQDEDASSSSAVLPPVETVAPTPEAPSQRPEQVVDTPVEPSDDVPTSAERAESVNHEAFVKKNTGSVDEEPTTGDPVLDATGVDAEPITSLEQPTGVAPNPKPRMSSSSSVNDDEEAGTQEYDEAATRALETRALRAEDLEALREAERARPRKRMITMGVVLGVLLVAVFVIWPKAPPPETDIRWPRDASGATITASVDGLLGGLDEGGYSVGFPGTRGWTKQESENNLVIATRVGRDLDVPLLLTLEEREDLRFLQMPLDEVVDAWMEERREAGRWTFDAPRGPLFMGVENGIPFYTVSYSMTDDGEWYGSARIFQIGARRIVLRSDIPYAERVRAGGMLDIRYILVSRELERRRWAGAADQGELSAAEIVRRVRPELDRVAPATWVGLENNLMRACRRAMSAGSQEDLEEAERLLVRLREMQALWFNAQRIARMEAQLQGDHARVRQISDMCKGVFSSTDDNRYVLVRRERW